MKSLFAHLTKLKLLKKPREMALTRWKKSKKNSVSNVKNRRKRNQRNVTATSLMKTNPKKTKLVAAMMTVKAKAVRNVAAAEDAAAAAESAGMKTHLKSQKTKQRLMRQRHLIKMIAKKSQNLAIVAARHLVRKRMIMLQR